METFRGHDDALYSTVFSPDGSQILTASYDGTAKLWRFGWKPKIDRIGAVSVVS